MTPEEVAIVLHYCAEAWPAMTVGDDTAIVWADALAGIDAQDAHTAARMLADTADYPPSIARLKATARQVMQRRQVASAPALPAPRRHGGAKLLAAIQAYAAAVERPAHDHHRGAEHCPCCSTSAERLRQWDADMRVLLHEAGVA
jgi:hypothetical protein